MADTARKGHVMRLILVGIFTAMLVCAVPPRHSDAKVYVVLEDALKETFPGAEKIDKAHAYLSVEEADRVQARAKGEKPDRQFTYYTAWDNGKIVGYAHFAPHVVRTKKAVTMVALNPDLSVRQVRVAAFYEPEEYLPAQGWFKMFIGKVLNDKLRPGQDVQAISGATLSVQRLTQQVRTAIAAFEVATGKRQ